MPLKRSSAFVLRSMKYGESDRIVTFFTKDFGKLTGIAKGAVRSRKRFGGVLEPLTEVFVTYEEKEGRELGRIDNCDLIESHVRSQEDIRVYYAFSYMAELVELFSSYNEADERFYRLLRAVIHSIEQKAALPLCIRYFELWVLKLQGILPEVQYCNGCGAEIRKSGGRFVSSSGDIYCMKCAARESGKSIPIRPEIIQFIAASMKKNVSAVEKLALYEKGYDADLEEFLHSIFTGFFDKPFKTYRYVRECLRN